MLLNVVNVSKCLLDSPGGRRRSFTASSVGGDKSDLTEINASNPGTGCHGDRPSLKPPRTLKGGGTAHSWTRMADRCIKPPHLHHRTLPACISDGGEAPLEAADQTEASTRQELSAQRSSEPLP